MNKHLLMTAPPIRVFGCGADGPLPQLPSWDDEKMKVLYGGKGAGVIYMRDHLGLPVPPGFVITTEICTYFYANGRTYPPMFEGLVQDALCQVEEKMDRRFGDTENWPLLVSVRSGARKSMPGMMDTVLNLGLNDETVVALARASSDARFAYDSYRQFIEMYSAIVLGLPKKSFNDEVRLFMEDRGIRTEGDLEWDDLKVLVEAFKDIVFLHTGQSFPQDPREQLMAAIGAVFKSWMSERAVTYRSLKGNIPESWGTAVTVQAMVFGNMDAQSATGVAFTRNPSTGKREFYGDWLPMAQGEAVVAGTHETHAITETDRIARGSTKPSLETSMPEIFKQLRDYGELLENEDGDMQDMEFTIESGKLWMLQHRKGQRTAAAAVKIAVEMTNEGLITKDEAVLRIDPSSLDQLFHPVLADPTSNEYLLTVGLPASPGAVSGEIVFSSDEAERIADEAKKLALEDKKVILVRIETSPEDIGGMHAAEGVLTTRGGMTSHAAVVGRGMGKPCVVGAKQLNIDYDEQSMTVDGATFKAGDLITICGKTGKVFCKEVATVKPELPEEYHTLMEWADSRRRLKVRANAETPSDARAARRFGAEGIGLARTEHMFFEGERILAVREMMLADDEAGRRKALAKLLPMQKQDFKEIFEIMSGLPVTIRLLDAPLHEFLPHTENEIASVARAMGLDPGKVRRRAKELSEFNPMLGFRGVRLSIVFPEIAEMQARAIFEAAVEANFSTDASGPALLEIMVPLVNFEKEFRMISDLIEDTARAVLTQQDVPIVLFKIGTMIELPRACAVAGKLAEQGAGFFSFGTNDLTQTALGISRDDAGTFLGHYVDKGIIPNDPFVTIDVEGVGTFIEMGVKRTRAVDPNCSIGICGEHGGDTESIKFFEHVGLDYVSCSPFRVPIARLAAAQAAIGSKGDQTK